MAMVYDPVTREFRPRESRAEAARARDGAPLPPAPGAPPEPERTARRTRRWVSLLRRRRQREILYWLLFILFTGGLIWGSFWFWSHMSPRHGYSGPPALPLDRYGKDFQR